MPRHAAIDLGRQPHHRVGHSHRVRSLRLEPAQRLIDYLAGFNRPLVQDGDLAAADPALDRASLHTRNPWAWRGPIRYGRGYGGNW